MGYHGLDVRLSGDRGHWAQSGRRYPYKVLSVQPDFVPKSLIQDRLPLSAERYCEVHPPLGWMYDLAGEITSVVPTGFCKVVSINDHLRRNGQYDEDGDDQLTLSASQSWFLLDGAKTRASTTPLTRCFSRGPMGYRPGWRWATSFRACTGSEGRSPTGGPRFPSRTTVGCPLTPTSSRTLISNGGQRPHDSRIVSLNYLFEASVGDDSIDGPWPPARSLPA